MSDAKEQTLIGAIAPHTWRAEMIIRHLMGNIDQIESIWCVVRVKDGTRFVQSAGLIPDDAGRIVMAAMTLALNATRPAPPQAPPEEPEDDEDEDPPPKETA